VGRLSEAHLFVCQLRRAHEFKSGSKMSYLPSRLSITKKAKSNFSKGMLLAFDQILIPSEFLQAQCRHLLSLPNGQITILETSSLDQRLEVMRLPFLRGSKKQ
jgi:hypothetical protein